MIKRLRESNKLHIATQQIFEKEILNIIPKSIDEKLFELILDETMWQKTETVKIKNDSIYFKFIKKVNLLKKKILETNNNNQLNKLYHKSNELINQISQYSII